MVGDGFDVELGGTGTTVMTVIEVAGSKEVGIDEAAGFDEARIDEVTAAEEVAAAVVLMAVERWLEVVPVLHGRVDVIELFE
jgi:hypothetical protein